MHEAGLFSYKTGKWVQVSMSVLIPDFQVLIIQEQTFLELSSFIEIWGQLEWNYKQLISMASSPVSRSKQGSKTVLTAEPGFERDER